MTGGQRSLVILMTGGKPTNHRIEDLEISTELPLRIWSGRLFQIITLKSVYVQGRK